MLDEVGTQPGVGDGSQEPELWAQDPYPPQVKVSQVGRGEEGCQEQRTELRCGEAWEQGIVLCSTKALGPAG